MSKKNEIKSLHNKTEEARPYIIHATGEFPVFPTHSHGMIKNGLPEFLMDPLSFGPYGTSSLINAAYQYFSKLENEEKLKDIMNGNTLKLTDKDLAPDKHGDYFYVYCFRRVYPDFEMVKQAYVIESAEDVDPAMRFIQIYVEGDDFALTDEYYKGGIKW
jgi:hypothetical protein